MHWTNTVASAFSAKRACDVVVAGVGLVALAPLFLALAIAVKLTSAGPIFYRGLRMGRGGQQFHIYKFRSMYQGEGWGITAAADPRITPLGQLLRRYKLDELPQLWNVIRGEMSIVGPRPEDPRYFEYYTSEQRDILSVRPGITGLTQLEFRCEENLLTAADPRRQYIEEIMPRKLDNDLRYLETQSLRLDLSIMLHTITALFD